MSDSFLNGEAVGGGGGGGGGDTPLPVGDAVHFWRLDDVAPHADIGSAAHVDMTEAGGGTWLYHRARLYRAFDATACDVTGIHVGMLADIPVNAGSWTLGVTLGTERGSVDPFITNGGNPLLLKFGNPAGGDHVSIYAEGGVGFRANVQWFSSGMYQAPAPITVDWARNHRLVVRWDDPTKTLTIALDGITLSSISVPCPSLIGMSRICVGGANGWAGSHLLFADVAYYDRALSDTEILADGNAATCLY